MSQVFKKLSLGTALAVTVMTGLVATPASAQSWQGHQGGGHQGGGNQGRGHGGDGAGVAIVAGVLGLALGAALVSHHRTYDEPVPVTYAPYAGPANCYDAYPGDDGTCYPVDDYYRMGWSWRDGSWWNRDGQRFAQPYMGRGGPDGGSRGGYARGGYDQRGDAGGGDHGGYDGGHGGDRGGGHDGDRGGDRGGDHGGGWRR